MFTLLLSKRLRRAPLAQELGDGRLNELVDPDNNVEVIVINPQTGTLVYTRKPNAQSYRERHAALVGVLATTKPFRI
jgi:hypothetical protein